MTTTVRQRLIDSASTLFAEKGYHAVGTREISAHAKANISLVSFYFGGKSGLLKTVLEGLIEAGVANTEDHLILAQNKQEFSERLEKFLYSMTAFQLQNADLLKIYMHELEAGNVDAANVNGYAFGGVWAKLVAFIKDAHEKKIISAPSAEATAISIMAPFTNLLQNKNCMAHLVHISLSDREFTKELINCVVSKTSA